MSHRSATRQRIAYFESLRGLAAMVIVIYHLGGDSWLIDNNLVNNAWMMLDFFFILSGCVITMAFQAQVRTALGVGDFLYGRFLRVYPLHLVMLGVFFALELVKLAGTTWLGIAADTPAFAENNATTLLHNLFFTNVLLVENLSWNKPAWSIAAEFWTYLIFALLALIFRHHPARFLSICGLIAFSAFVFLANHDMSAYHGMARCLWGFFLGVLLAHLVTAERVRCSARLANLAVILTAVILTSKAWPFMDGRAVFFTSVFFFLLLALFTSPDDTAFKRLLGNRYLVRLGTISFGIYMIHSAVWWILSQAARVVTRLQPELLQSGGYEDALQNPMIANVVLFIGLPLTIALAEWSYRKLEYPIYQKRWTRPRWLQRLAREDSSLSSQP
ncbi:acyltransferase [Primorskyibacter aestuariivivens]|uniref:acyltransferase family protein n=1 Tax=Primorskyibacter aestuariivivens TaxID=1888912 RepID=UPI0023002AC4|nr:acyltransferase [Primorskyibacter aestuariivivens]MDA7428701.1 acyltransferase [Primorskyibacter aestuariivivens]